MTKRKRLSTGFFKIHGEKSGEKVVISKCLEEQITLELKVIVKQVW